MFYCNIVSFAMRFLILAYCTLISVLFSGRSSILSISTKAYRLDPGLYCAYAEKYNRKTLACSLTHCWLFGSVGLVASQCKFIPECQVQKILKENSVVSKASTTFALNMVVLVMI